MSNDAYIEQLDSTETRDNLNLSRFLRKYSGFIHTTNETIASYFVTINYPYTKEMDAVFDLITGTWGENSLPEDRTGVSVEYKLLETGPTFWFVNAPARRVWNLNLVSNILTREAAISSSHRTLFLNCCEFILSNDQRLKTLLSGWQIDRKFRGAGESF